MGTHHEEALEELKDLPGEIQRSMALIGQLDRESYGQLPTIKAKQQAYIRDVRKRLQTKPRAPGVDLRSLSEDPGALDEIKRLKADVMQKAKEKIAVAQQAESLIADYIQRLDARIKAVKSEVDVAGDRERYADEENYDAGVAHGAMGMGSASNLGLGVQAHGYDTGQAGAASGGAAYGGRGGGVTVSGAGADAAMQQADAMVSDETYCICGQPGHGEMVGCDYVGPNGEQCEIGGGWFHLACVGLTKLPGKDESWYCDTHREMMEEEARGGRRKKRRTTRG